MSDLGWYSIWAKGVLQATVGLAGIARSARAMPMVQTSHARLSSLVCDGSNGRGKIVVEAAAHDPWTTSTSRVQPKKRNGLERRKSISSFNRTYPCTTIGVTLTYNIIEPLIWSSQRPYVRDQRIGQFIDIRIAIVLRLACCVFPVALERAQECMIKQCTQPLPINQPSSILSQAISIDSFRGCFTASNLDPYIALH